MKIEKYEYESSQMISPLQNNPCINKSNFQIRDIKFKIFDRDQLNIQTVPDPHKMSAKSNYQQHFEEPSLDTIKKEVLSIGMKIKYVILMLPGDRDEAIKQLKKWDLWGPLLIGLVFSLSLALAANQKYEYDDFINVFLIFWIGGFLVSVNCKLLGNKGSLFQAMSVIGYCLIPLSIFGLLVSILGSILPGFVKLIIIILALAWSTVSCLIVMRDLVSQQRKWLCAYPIMLFYIFLGWYAIIA